MSKLPSSDQTWSHGTNSAKKIADAIRDSDITAIEGDILMGNDRSALDNGETQPIMSHPPIFESDLSAAKFLDLVTQSSEQARQRILAKHIKLDFKVIHAVEPTLKIFRNLQAHGNNKTVFLNADVLPGPGRSVEDIKVPADEFVQTCLALFPEPTESTKAADYAFSLGFKVAIEYPSGHTHEHLQEMASLVRRHDLTNRCAGVVLAINARLLYKNIAPFEWFLLEFPSTQMLVWTGSGEPPLSKRKLNYLKNHFESSGSFHRVGFDCDVAPSYVSGLAWDLAVDVYGLYVGLYVFPSKLVSGIRVFGILLCGIALFGVAIAIGKG